MLSNHFITAWRRLNRERFFSFLNIAGLAVALTCSAFIGLWCWDEWRRDRFFPNADRIARVNMRMVMGKESFDQAVTSVRVAPNMKKDFPEVEDYCRLDANEVVVTANQRQFSEKNVLTADSSFFRVFDYALKSGDPNGALAEPYTVVLTEALAQKYFGDQNPLGQTLKLNLFDDSDKGAVYRVTGVLAGACRPSHINFDMLVSFASFFAYNPEYLGEDGWYESSYYTYILLRPGAQATDLQSKMPAFFQQYLQPLWGDDTKAEFDIQPLSDIYLHSNRRYEMGVNGNAAHLYIFGTVGLLILLVAGVNYVNMATARAAKQARAVGVRKVLGARRGQLALQFLVSSVLTAALAAGVALIGARAAQPLFEQMTGKTVGLFDVPFLPFLLAGGALLLGLGAGAYPAFVQSAYRPVSVLKGRPDSLRAGGSGLRQFLTVLQFAVSIILIISVLAIGSQMDFIRSKSLGFNKEALLVLQTSGAGSVTNGIAAFKTELAAMPSLVRGVAVSNTLLAGDLGNSSIVTVDDTGKKIETNIYRMRIDDDYVPVMGLQLLAGRNFSRAFPADWPTDTTQNYLLNAAAVRAFGWESPEQAVGKPFVTHNKRGVVVGVVDDFHFNSLKNKVEPLCIHPATTNFSKVFVRVDMERAREAVAHVESVWRRRFPDALFDYAFLDERLERQYRSELRFGALFGVFSIFSIFIACLGLLGLAADAAEQRTKEIGIRKVLGASVASVGALLTKDFLKLVLLAFIVASPIAWYFMNRWLADFAYRIELRWWMFAAAGAAAVLTAFLTVSFQSVQAALANPVKSLRSE